MTQPDIIQTILKDSNYRLGLFSDAEIDALRERVRTKTGRGGKTTAYVECVVRGGEIQLKPKRWYVNFTPPG